MPSTYQLFPGLKQILEDKRIRRFGVPEFDYQNYLMAEQFVVDMRPMSEYETRKQISETYDALAEMSLDCPPCENFLIHTIEEDSLGKTAIVSYYFTINDLNGKSKLTGNIRNIVLLFESEQSLSFAHSKTQEIKNVLTERSHWAMIQLIVMLATTGTIKEKHDPKPSHLLSGGKPHKKGSGGYTIIRSPEAHELAGGGSGRTVRPHFRRGHIRKLDPLDKTRWVWVSPCFIHGEPEVQRKAYLVA